VSKPTKQQDNKPTPDAIVPEAPAQPTFTLTATAPESTLVFGEGAPAPQPQVPAQDPAPESTVDAPAVLPVAPAAASPEYKLFNGRCAECPGDYACVDYREINGKAVAIDTCVKARGEA
jgi:hypothetical protein